MSSSEPAEIPVDSSEFDPSQDRDSRLRRGDKDRYLCALFAPAERRDDLLALYDFNLETARVRDTVSEALVGQLRLKWWYDAMDAVAAGDPPKHPVAEALSAAVVRHGIDGRQLRDLIAARAADLDPVQPADMAALRKYADDTAGAVARAGLQILGAAPSPAAEAAAAQVAAAWAYVGLLRAAPHHAPLGRLYLPAEVCAAHGLASAEALKMRLDKPSPAPLRRAVEQVAAAAADHLAEARAMGAECPKAALPVLLPAVLADHYLGLLGRCGFDPADLRMSRPGPGPAATLRLAWRAFRRKF